MTLTNLPCGSGVTRLASSPGKEEQIDWNVLKGPQMKFKSIVCLALAAAAGPLFAAAATAPAPNQMDPATLGRLDALLTVCAKADAKNRAIYERYRTEMIVFGEGTPNEMRVEGSDTPEYKRAHTEVVEAAGKASQEELVQQCDRVIGVQGGGKD